MELHELQMLEGLRAFLASDSADCFLESEEAWQKLWNLCMEQKVLPMVLDVLIPAAAKKDRMPTGLPMVRVHVLQSTAAQLQKTHAFLTLYETLCSHGFRPLVVKGILCRELYPKPDLRPSADEDLLVSADEMPAILKILREKGLTIENEDDEQVVSCRDEKTGLYLELHRSLFSRSSRAYGDLNGLFSQVFARSVAVKVGESVIHTLHPEDHFLYLILHSFKHFLHSGFGIRQVCDICLFAQTYSQDIEWETVGQSLESARADIFGANLLEIGRRYLGFHPYPQRVQNWLSGKRDWLDCDDLLADLLAGGIYGGNREERRHSSRITLNAAANREESGKDYRLLRTIFPRKEELISVYPYLDKHGWLLPAAWGQRILAYARKGGGSAGAKESIAIGERRVALMKKYRVIR